MKNNCNYFYQYKLYNHLKYILNFILVFKLVFKLKFYDHKYNIWTGFEIEANSFPPFLLPSYVPMWFSVVCHYLCQSQFGFY